MSVESSDTTDRVQHTGSEISETKTSDELSFDELGQGRQACIDVLLDFLVDWPEETVIDPDGMRVTSPEFRQSVAEQAGYSRKSVNDVIDMYPHVILQQSAERCLDFSDGCHPVKVVGVDVLDANPHIQVAYDKVVFAPADEPDEIWGEPREVHDREYPLNPVPTVGAFANLTKARQRSVDALLDELHNVDWDTVVKEDYITGVTDDFKKRVADTAGHSVNVVYDVLSENGEAIMERYVMRSIDYGDDRDIRSVIPGVNPVTPYPSFPAFNPDLRDGSNNDSTDENPQPSGVKLVDDETHSDEDSKQSSGSNSHSDAAQSSDHNSNLRVGDSVRIDHLVGGVLLLIAFAVIRYVQKRVLSGND